jgi:hypothetical protein
MTTRKGVIVSLLPVFVLAAVFFSVATHAGNTTQNFAETDIHDNDSSVSVTGTCTGSICDMVYVDSLSTYTTNHYVYVGTSALESGLTGCTHASNTVLLDLSSTHGTELYALLLSASLADKKVQLFLASTAGGLCTITTARLWRSL